MSKNPVINAGVATLYISIVALVPYFGKNAFGSGNSFLIPIAMLSLFTLSAAVMAYLFLYQPLMLFLDGKKKQAVNLFLQTVAIFAGITAVVFILLFTGVLK